MALVINIEKGFKNRHSIHKKTECSYFVVYDKLDGKFLQLETTGSEDREIIGKVNQSIQFSPNAIMQLKKILEKEF